MQGDGSGLLAGKRIVVTGVLTEASIAAHVATVAREQGAELILTTPPRVRRITERTARHLDLGAPVVDLDVTDGSAVSALGDEWQASGLRIDGLVHAVAFAPPACIGGSFSDAAWDDVAIALHISSYSLAALGHAVAPVMPPGAGIVALDFDATKAWPMYNWMGVAKAALASTAQYLAAELGPRGLRVNLVASGPLRTLAASAIGDFDRLEREWASRAPLGWDVREPEPTARAVVALLSDWFPATTAERVHVDGGYHGTWASAPDEEQPYAATARGAA